MISNPVIRIYQAFLQHEVRFILIGGQAAILYGAAEFTRDSDFCILCNPKNLDNIKKALKELKAKQVFFPPLQPEYLDKGHACHFLCGLKEVEHFRIDIMSKMRNCPDFTELWKSRRYFSIDPDLKIPVINKRHLIAAKKTQRDKDWPVIRRLIEADYHERLEPSEQDVEFWTRECRTPEILFTLADKWPETLKKNAEHRPLLTKVFSKDFDLLEDLLMDEEKQERRKDRMYWEPLKRELEHMRHERKS